MEVSYLCFSLGKWSRSRFAFTSAWQHYALSLEILAPSLFVNVAIMYKFPSFIAVWCLTLLTVSKINLVAAKASF